MFVAILYRCGLTFYKVSKCAHYVIIEHKNTYEPESTFRIYERNCCSALSASPERGEQLWDDPARKEKRG